VVAEQGLGDRSISAFLEGLASSAPSPGGGAAASLVGSMAASLVSMVCNLTIGRPRYAAVDGPMRAILVKSEALREALTRLADDDTRAYEVVAAAYRLPKATDADRAVRHAAIQRALEGAAVPPQATMEACRALLPLSLQVAAHGNSTVASDAGVAAELAVAGVRSSIINVLANLTDLHDADFIARAEARIADAESGMVDDLHRVSAIVRAKLAPKIAR